jgi:hypothetical protein
LIEFYLNKSALNPICFDDEIKRSWEPQKAVKVIPAHEREAPYRRQGNLNYEFEWLHVVVPVVMNPDIPRLLELIPNGWMFRGVPDVKYIDSSFRFNVPTKGYGYNFNEETIAEKVKSALSAVDEWVKAVNSDLSQYNEQLKRTTSGLIDERRTKLQQDAVKLASLVQKIDIPLRPSEAAVVITRIKLDPKPIVKRLKPNPQLPEEFVLDRARVLDVITLIDNQGRQFEKTPKSFGSFGEESLRDLILANLNMLFEGKATGETFSYRGKSDIYLVIDRGNILICECKIWNGAVLYNETIDQLRGYLSWRHNFGIMITFSRNKSLTNILTEIPEIIKQNQSFSSGYKQLGPTHFISQHRLEQDNQKIVEMHHLFYNLYSGD